LTLNGELRAFATFPPGRHSHARRQHFTVDIELKVARSRRPSRAGESPMVSTGIPTKTLTVEGDLLRAALSAHAALQRRLDHGACVNSRNSGRASGQRMYYFHGTTLFATVITLEGQPAGT